LEKIHEIANEMRESLSEYCMNECKSYCCRKGYLIVNKEELDLISNDKKEILVQDDSIKEMLNGKFTLRFENCYGSCPSLNLRNFKCLIYKNELRPETCKLFPIFIIGNKIKISNRCPAKKDNKFFKFEKMAKELGYEIVEDFF